MNRSTDTRNHGGNLPGFLGSNQDAGNQASVDDVDPEVETTHYEDAESEEASDEDYDQNDYEQQVDEDENEDDADDYEPPVRPSARRTRHRYQPATQSPAGGLLLAVGMLTALAGAATAFMPVAAGAMTKIIEPQIIVILGVALVAIAAGMRRTARLQQRLERMESQRHQSHDELRETLAEIAQGANQASGESPDVQHLMMSLQRQDQKINNLTKAIKMYGKPLMEIAGQGTELAGSVSQVKTLIEGATESTRQAVNRVEQQVRSGSEATELGDLPKQIGKLEVSLAAVAQRLEDSEVRKSLVRLEDACKAMSDQLLTLGQGDNVKAATTELQQSLDNATQGLAKGIEQMRDGNLSGLEASIREIQRELSGLATGMSQIQAAVKSSNAATGTARAAQPAPAAAAPAATASATATPAASTPAASNAAAKKDDDKHANGYATGKRQVASKNVLGAIAKLKQMKG